jgi:hypothetical protein
VAEVVTLNHVYGVVFSNRGELLAEYQRRESGLGTFFVDEFKE